MSRKTWTDEQFIHAVKESYSYSEVCRKLNLSPKGGNLKTVRETIKKLKLDSLHFTGMRWNKGKTSKDHLSIRKKDISKILICNSKNSSSAIRKRLILEGLKEEKCECCRRSEWMGIKIPLELHHINGDHYDNRLENLLILCPNCHALTDSHISIGQLSALVEKQEVEGRKIREALLARLEKVRATGNPEPSLTNKEGAETIHVQPKSLTKCLYCGKAFKGQKEQKYCSGECSQKIRSKRPDVSELIKKFKELKSYVQVGRFYNVSDSAVCKWVKLYNIKDMVKR